MPCAPSAASHARTRHTLSARARVTCDLHEPQADRRAAAQAAASAQHLVRTLFARRAPAAARVPRAFGVLVFPVHGFMHPTISSNATTSHTLNLRPSHHVPMRRVPHVQPTTNTTTHVQLCVSAVMRRPLHVLHRGALVCAVGPHPVPPTRHVGRSRRRGALHDADEPRLGRVYSTSERDRRRRSAKSPAAVILRPAPGPCITIGLSE